MNASQPQPPGDNEIDALLARRYRDTSPEFEARWVGLKREMRSAPRPSRQPWFVGWNRWFTLAGAVAAVVLTVSVWRKSPPADAPVEVSPALAELFAMDAVLGRGAAAENPEIHTNLPEFLIL